MTKNVWNAIKEIEEKLHQSGNILLLLDYDGTLAAIEESPSKAKLPVATKKVLTEIKKSEKISLGIVSGRGIYDIKRHIGIDGIIYAGNHGLEWQLGKKIYVLPKISKTRALYITILDNFSPLEKKYRGIFIQDKNLSISIHYRMLDKSLHAQFKKDFEAFMQPYLKSSLIELLKNKKVFDIMPNVEWGKGSLIKLLISKKKSSPLTIYIGDDRTDEDAFSELKEAITIKVGKGETHAKYFLNDIDDTAMFLKWIYETIR